MSLPINRTALIAAQTNQVPNMVLQSALNIAAIQTPYDTIDELNIKVDANHAAGGTGSTQLADNSVITQKIAPLAVTNEKVANATLTADKFVPGVLTNETANGLQIVAIKADLMSVEIPLTNYRTLWVGNDITAAMKQIVLDYPTGQIVISLPSGSYVISDRILFTQSAVYVRGAGMLVTILTFKPTANAKMFEWNAGATRITYGGIKDLMIISDETITAYQMIAIELWDISRFDIENVQIKTFDGKNTNIGLYTHGREILTTRNLNISAPNPLVIGKNPNTPTAPILDADHFHFTNLYLDSSYGPCVLVENDVVLTNTTFDGEQPWVRGNKGFYWSSPTQAYSSYHLRIANMRTEQATDPAQYSIYIDAKLQGFVLENSRLAIARNGVYLRQVSRISLRDVSYTSTSLEALNVDGTCDALELNNCFFQNGSTISLGDLYEKISFNKLSTTSPIPEYAFYSRAATGVTQNQQPIKVLGTKMWNWSGSLADSAQLRTPVIGALRNVAVINFSVRNAANSILEGGILIDCPESTKIVSCTSNVVLTNTAGKIVILKDTGDSMKLLNRTGFTVDCVISFVYQ